MVTAPSSTTPAATGARSHDRSPRLRFTVPAPGRYRVEVHVNAGRPGARVLERVFQVRPTTERNAAADEATQLAKRGGAAPVGTYREMLVAVLAAQRLTERGDPDSYQRALALLRPVKERLHAIWPAVLERAGHYGYARNAIDRRFGAAMDAVNAWVVWLATDAKIATDRLVTAFEGSVAEIKMGTGEQVDDRDLRALDGAAITTAKAVGVATAVVVLLPVAVELGAMAGAEFTASSLARWVAMNPFKATALAEFVASHAIAIGEAGGLRNYVRGLKDDPFAAVLIVLMDFQSIRSAAHADSAPVDGGSSGARPLPAGEAPPPAPRLLGPGSGEEVGIAPTGAARPRGGGPAADPSGQPGGPLRRRDRSAVDPAIEVETTAAVAATADGDVSPFALKPASTLNKRQRKIHELLPASGEMAKFKKHDVSMNDLRAIGRVTGDEYSMYTLRGQRLVIRGQGNRVIVPNQEFADALFRGEYGRWSGHTHPPGYSLAPGPADRPSIPSNQRRSAIWADDGVKVFYRDGEAEAEQRRADFRKQYGEQEDR